MTNISLMTKSEVARTLRCTVRTVENMMTAGVAPPSVKLGRMRRFPVCAFEEWLSARLAASNKATPAEAT